jgi:hypothetical protein
VTLPLVNVFSQPYEVWSKRNATQDEMIDFYNANGYFIPEVKDKLQEVIDSHFKAAEYIIKVGADNDLEYFIDEALDKSQNFKLMRNRMPKRTPKEIFNYQKKYHNCNFIKVNQAINKYGDILHEGQYLFHGGLWPKNSRKFKTDRPLSISFCPEVALRNALLGGKAYDANEINLFVLKAINPSTKVFVMRVKGTNLGHEKEILFSSGALLTLRSKRLVKENYRVCKVINGVNTVEKNVPAYVLEVDIS